MDIILHPHPLRGNITAPPSKSMAHRYLICAALADHPTQLACFQSNRDIDATISCIKALGAEIQLTESGLSVFPVKTIPQSASLTCGESGTTLRLLLPIAGALGIDATFTMEGRLPSRPLSPLWEEMERMGCHLSRPTENSIRCTGKLRPGKYSIDGSVSSQFVSGLLFATSLLPGSELEITGRVESAPYIAMSRHALASFHAPDFHSPGHLTVEGDWSNAAFWLAASHLGNSLNILNIDDNTLQGDRAIVDLLPQLITGKATISAADIPDLIPILSIFAAANHGAVFTDIARLRLKESDRVAAIVHMIQSLGGKAEATEQTLSISGTGLHGGIVDSFGDHRIAMSAAIAATVCKEKVTILNAQCVEKSYPVFWGEYQRLGGVLCKVPTETT